MKVAFYAPLKSPDHAVPSGDRQMARLLIAALRLAGHEVDIVSRLRSYLPEPDGDALTRLHAEADAEMERIAGDWAGLAAPGCWFTYHPYYKAPDLIGPLLSRRFDIPYFTAEASHSSRRNQGAWTATQKLVVEAVNHARVNFCFTGRDLAGLAAVAPAARLVKLPPFIDIDPYAEQKPRDNPARLVTVAMMRSGDKFDSYRMLAEALPLLLDLPWTLSVIGDGPRRADVVALFDRVPPQRIAWLGLQAPGQIPALLCQGGLYVWPGCGEAYGLAYLEAQAAGLPVVAQDIAGVPEVVRNGLTGLLTRAGDAGAFSGAIRQLLIAPNERQIMAAAARRFVLDERSLAVAAQLIGGEMECLDVR